jgi:hypothetical protein
VLDDLDLVEEDEGVEDGKGGVVEDARQNDVFEVLQPVRVVDLLPHLRVADLDDLLEPRGIAQVFPVVRLEGGEFGVVLERAEHAVDELVADHLLYYGVLVEQDDGLHDAAEPVQVGKALEVLGVLHQGNELGEVVGRNDKARQRFATRRGAVGHAHGVLDVGEVGHVRVWQHELLAVVHEVVG